MEQKHTAEPWIAELRRQVKLAKENTESLVNHFDKHTISGLKAKIDHIDYRLMEAQSLFPTPADGGVT